MLLGEVHNGGVFGPWDSELNVVLWADGSDSTDSTAATENGGPFVYTH
jgi:hypothetical protein